MRNIAGYDKLRFNCWNCKMDARQTWWSENITAPNPWENYFFIALDRKISNEEVKRQKLKLMPGFRLTWDYNSEPEADATYAIYETTKEFIR